MKILIATGLGKVDVGGPFQYGPRLKEEFEKLGHTVRLVQFGSIESALLGLFPHVLWSEKVIALDTFSVGMPSVLFAVLLRKKVIIRVGGDFAWSAYVNRTKKPLSLPEFYRTVPKLGIKEKIIFILNRWAIKNAHYLAFNTEWQRRIWTEFYKLSAGRTGIVRNFIPRLNVVDVTPNKNFLWAGRLIPEKNPQMLNKLKIDIVTSESHAKVLEKIKASYAVTSLAYSDICPNFIIEGLSYGKPFVMTRETGLGEIFSPCGIFVDPQDEDGIRDAMDAMRDKVMYDKYREEIKRLNLSRPWSEIADEFLNIWKRV